MARCVLCRKPAERDGTICRRCALIVWPARDGIPGGAPIPMPPRPRPVPPARTMGDPLWASLTRSELIAWAAERGMHVGARGRVPESVKSAWVASWREATP